MISICCGILNFSSQYLVLESITLPKIRYYQKKSSWRWSDNAFRLAQDPVRWSYQYSANWPPGNSCLDNAAGRQTSPLIPENNPNALASALLFDG